MNPLSVNIFLFKCKRRCNEGNIRFLYLRNLKSPFQRQYCNYNQDPVIHCNSKCGENTIEHINKDIHRGSPYVFHVYLCLLTVYWSRERSVFLVSSKPDKLLWTNEQIISEQDVFKRIPSCSYYYKVYSCATFLSQ